MKAMNRYLRESLIALLAATLLAGCGKPSVPEGGPDAVVLIVIDTLRADHLGSYGFEGAISPVLDELAGAGVRFADVTTTAPVTVPAVASILTGRIPPDHGVRDNAGFVLAPEHVSLAERFQDAGWKTGAAPFGQVNGERKALRGSIGNRSARTISQGTFLW